MIHCDPRVEGTGGRQLNVKGIVELKLTLDGKSVLTDVYVIQGIPRPLLSRGVIEHIGIVKRLKKVSNQDQKKKKIS